MIKFLKNVFSVTSICRIHNLKDSYVKGHRRNTLEDNTHKRTHKVTYKQKTSKFYRHILDKIKFVLKSLDDAKSQVSKRGEPRNPVKLLLQISSSQMFAGDPGYIHRSSHRRCSGRKAVLRNFAKFTRKHLCQSLFLNKFAGQEQLFLQNTSRRVLLATPLCTH